MLCTEKVNKVTKFKACDGILRATNKYYILSNIIGCA